jgi:hypothetical protein
MPVLMRRTPSGGGSWHLAGVGDPVPSSQDDDHLCPECAAGKHGNCDGTAWCWVQDRAVPCLCGYRSKGAFPVTTLIALEHVTSPVDGAV